ncbi:lasso peptide biosynthesis B2 protein [Streptomyces sp. TRM70308]|uniref:lasso peptide biosynthesis B2 protein n=1 Tax=Streptomyces sp. TRM70308 TaxID=3131932 RepID=UPI003D085E33
MTSMEAYKSVRVGSFLERLAAATGLTLSLALLRLPFRHTVHVVRLARQIGCHRLDVTQAEVLVDAVQHAARLWPGRMACMETSLGTVLAAALLGRRLNWVLGARFSPPPVEYHAWVELPDQGPVGEYTAAGWHHHAALTV